MHKVNISRLPTIKAFVRLPKDKTKYAHVRFRLSDGRGVQLFYKSKITVLPSLWNGAKEQYKTKCQIDDSEKARFDKTIIDYKRLLLDVYNNGANIITNSKTFSLEVDKRLYPEKNKQSQDSFFSLFSNFLKNRKLSEDRKRNYEVIMRMLKRYELYRSIIDNQTYLLDIDSVSIETLSDIEDFLYKEPSLFSLYPEIYSEGSKPCQPRMRGQNTINTIMTRLKTLFIWLEKNNFTRNNPFNNYKIKECVYGTPCYISINERDKIMDTDLSDKPSLAIHRDIFIFQCLIGCRVSDLWKMTTSNIVNGAIEYIAQKTKNEHPTTIRVPLNNKANKILQRYNYSKERLFPFPSQQTYNISIKQIFLLSGITRMVTVFNPTTGKTIQKPINEIASSHMARRTFIGNLYKQVRDPSLVSALSGHSSNNKAFTRYRVIDDDIKIELMNMLE